MTDDELLDVLARMERTALQGLRGVEELEALVRANFGEITKAARESVEMRKQVATLREAGRALAASAALAATEPKEIERSWSIHVQQGAILVGVVELLHDGTDCKVFSVCPRDESGFGGRQFYAHGACYAAVLGAGLRGKETTVSLAGAGGGWHSFVHSAANGLIWTLVRWREPEKVWGRVATEPKGTT